MSQTLRSELGEGGVVTPFLERAIAEMLPRADPARGCEECGFSWEIAAEEARGRIDDAPDRFARLLAGRDGVRHETGWSPSAYVWHVGDVVRAWAERLHALAADPSARWAGFDPDELARVRGYDRLPQATGPWALARATEALELALAGLGAGTGFTHPEWGPGTVDDALRWLAHEVVHHELDVRRGLGLD